MKTTNVAIAAAMVMLAAPFALAYNQWPGDDNAAVEDPATGEHGNPPGSPTRDQYKFPEGDFIGTTDPAKIYFDVYVAGDAEQTFLLPGYNGAVGLADGNSRLLGPATALPFGLLGYWWDCNADGYVGDGTTGMYLYEPTGDASAAACEGARTISSINLVDHVHEFIAIGDLGGHNGICPGCDDDNDPDTPHPEEGGILPCSGGADPCLNPLDEFFRADDPRVTVNDSGSKVWGDWNTPDTTLPSTGVVPVARGTFSTTGGHIKYVDSLTDHAIRDAVFLLGQDGEDAWNELTCADDSAAPLLATNPGAHGDSPDTSCGAANVENPVGYLVRETYNNRVSNDPDENDESDNDGSSEWVDMDWDCGTRFNPDGQDIIVTADPLNNGGPKSSINTDNNPPYGSLHGQLANIDEGLGEGPNNCDSDPEGMPFNSLEGSASDDIVVRSKHDYSFSFVDRGYDEYDLDDDNDASDPANRDDPDDRLDLGVWGGGNYWSPGEQFILTRKHAVTANKYLTFYAKVSGEAFDSTKNPAVPTGASEGASTPAGDLVVDIYGREGCEKVTGTANAGTTAWQPVSNGGVTNPGLFDAADPTSTNGWECDPDIWATTNSIGAGMTAAQVYAHVLIGQSYTFRDIDCFDNFSGVDGVYASTAGVLGDCNGDDILP